MTTFLLILLLLSNAFLIGCYLHLSEVGKENRRLMKRIAESELRNSINICSAAKFITAHQTAIKFLACCAGKSEQIESITEFANASKTVTQ